jgi:hypothetical protein
MIDRILIDSLNINARDFATKWKNLIRKEPHLIHFNAMDDEALIESDRHFYPLLARTLDRGLDRPLVGDFFVKIGKEKMREGYPISEVIYALNLIEKVVLDFIMTEYAPENPMRMYQAMTSFSTIAEFFLLGSFYITKGFLEETYTSMNAQDNVSKELLKKYFRDDFFFKQN